MKNWISNNFLSFVVIILISIVYFQQCRSTNSIPVKQDTVIKKYYYSIIKDTTIIDPVVRDVVKYKEINIPKDTSVSFLLKEIKNLKEELLSKNIYSDTIPVDTIGIAILDETVEQNKIAQRKIKYALKIPVIEKTITKESTKNKWFIGTSLEGNKESLVKQLNGNILLIKKDKGYEVGTGIDLNGKIYYRAGIFWKL